MATSGRTTVEPQGHARVVGLQDRAARFAAAADLAEIRPDLAAEEPAIDERDRKIAGILSAIRPTGPVYRVTSVARLIRNRKVRGLDPL